MKFILIFILLTKAVFAHEFIEHKKGLALGVGASFSQYDFPNQFLGETVNQIDDKATIIGPSLNVGYDVVMFNRLLLGLRGEGIFMDTLGMGAKDNSKISDQTIGKIRAFNLSLRGGLLFDFKSINPLAEKHTLIGEIFLEGGIGSGHKSFSKKYSYNDGTINEFYRENLEEDFISRVFALGINLTTQSGAFFEIKSISTAIFSNTIEFSGTELVNGGSATSRTIEKKDFDMKPVTSFLITVGHHY